MKKDGQGEVGIERREIAADARAPGVARRGGRRRHERRQRQQPWGSDLQGPLPVPNEELGISGKMAKLRIFRGDAEGGEEIEYEIPLVEGMVVLDAVLAIQAQQAPDLAVRWNCKAAHCGSCSAEINGRPKLLCKTRVEEYEGAEIHVGPMRAFPVIKDLVSDVSWNYEVSKGIKPFRAASRRPSPCTRRMSSALRAEEVHRVLYVPGCLPRPQDPPQAPRVRGTTLR